MKIDESIIDKVLNNEASAEDARNVSAWFATDEGREYLLQCLGKDASALTDEVAESWVSHPIPEEKMQHRFLEQIQMHPKRQPKFPRRWLIAVVLIPFIFLSVSVTYLADKVGLFSDVEYAELVVPCGELMRVVLQDGTIVQLNSDTYLRYPKKFGLFHRTVELRGEGYFEVAKEKNRPFIVDLKELNVKVTGTKFNVKAYRSEANVWVTLDEGGVILQDMGGKEYQLYPGESAEYNRHSGSCQISVPKNEEQISSWRSNSLNFYLIPLKDIIKVLERQYDIQFIVPDSTLLENRFTLSTSKVNVKDVLNDLEAVSYITFSEKESGVFEIGHSK